MNNNTQNNNDLNAISLGSVDNLNNNYIPPASSNQQTLNSNNTLQEHAIETLDSNKTINNQENFNGIINENLSQNNVTTNTVTLTNDNATDNYNNTVLPVEPLQYDVPDTINNFSTTSVFNDIGTVPPVNNTVIPTPIINDDNGNENKPKKDKKMNKLLFIIIIVLLITAVGVGVYILLGVTNKSPKSSVVPKNVEIEMGSSVSTDINDYATFNGINSNNCSLDTSNITDTNKLDATYTFNITCGSTTYSGNAKIVDKTAPIVVLKEANVQVNGVIESSDFIDSCTDASTCSYEFKDENKVNEFLSAVGNYHVDIIVKDEAGNEIEVTGTLIVSEDEIPDLYLSCKNDNEELKLGITSSVFTGNITKVSTFTLEINDYNGFKEANKDKSEVTYQNITGSPLFNDNDYTLTILTKMTKEDYEQINNISLPSTYGELRSLFTENGYTCALEQP